MKKILLLILISVITTTFANANPTKLRSYSVGIKRNNISLYESHNITKATHYYTHYR
ncbi:hypothetical protein [Francisella salimarina]|uniref:Uncharacterized protein n=1 Tax=Francisella salimarina TaxID=2599927 RepID=A0AAJ4NNA6_9GAMM|nr:hypothetical protein [Francisella salimarina]QWU98796.1 hypothetical protein KQR59_06690 [Francisella salimarina]